MGCRIDVEREREIYTVWIRLEGVDFRRREGRFKAQCGSMPRKLATALPVTPVIPIP